MCPLHMIQLVSGYTLHTVVKLCNTKQQYKNDTIESYSTIEYGHNHQVIITLITLYQLMLTIRNTIMTEYYNIEPPKTFIP